ncbi:MAG: serine/threonine protein kinase [Planctomycetota bacterium]
MPGSGAEKMIGGFKILREIGRGGMAIVYEVEDPAGKRLALKVLDAARSRNERSLGRFLREGEAIQRLNHPHIIKIIDVGQDGDLSFIAMELIDGPTLEDLIFELRRGRRDALSHFRPDFVGLPDPVIGQSAFQRAVLESLAEIANAVQAAHDAGLVHRDIKPSNILIDSDSRMILTDFGLVQDLGADTLTLTGDVLGTPLYMSPEQIAGNRDRIGPKSDIYALGATIHETLGLNSPFSATDIAVLAKQIARHEPRDLAELNPHLPKSVHTIVKRAMAKRPNDRYSQASNIARDIELFLRGEPIEAKPPTPREHVRSLMRRHPKVVWGVLAAVALVLVALSTLFIVYQRDERVRIEEASRTVADGQVFLGQGLWAAAWRAAEEVEVELGDGDKARSLRSEIEFEFRTKFALNQNAGLAPLRVAHQMRIASAQLEGTTLDLKSMDAQLSASLVKVATESGYGFDEGALDSIWNSLHTGKSKQENKQWAQLLSARCDQALLAFDFRFAFVISDRAQRWGLDCAGFPQKNYAIWNTTPYARLQEFTQDLVLNPWPSVLGSIDRDAFMRFPWPHSRAWLQAILVEADLAESIAILRLTERIGLIGMTQGLIEKSSSTPELRGDLVAFWATQPDVGAHEALIRWWPEFKGTRDALRLVTALKNPTAAARRFLEREIPLADLNLLQVLAEVLGETKERAYVDTLGARLILMDEVERQPLLVPYIQLGGKPPWSWIEQGIEARGGLWNRLTATLEKHPDIAPLSWSRENVDHPDPSLRRIARRSLLSHPTTREEWSRKILFDSQEAMAFRVQIGLSLGAQELFKLLKDVDLLRNQDAILVGLSLWLDSGLFTKGSRAHLKRVASLFEVYRESNDDLMKSWALHALARLDIPEFAVLIAKDLAAYEVDSTGSLLRDILGRSPQSLILGQVIQEIAKQPKQNAAFINQDVNAARCRFLALIGRDKAWGDPVIRQAVVRVLIECAARRDLSAGTRQAALRSLSNFTIDLHLDEIRDAAHYDVDGRVGAAAAVLIAEAGEAAQALEFLDQRLRPGKEIVVARAWVLAKMGRFAESISNLELAAMQGFRQTSMTLDFRLFPKLQETPQFRSLWRRIVE